MGRPAAKSKRSYRASISGYARAALARRRKKAATESLKRVKPYVPHGPSPRQEAFLRLDAEEALYGGAAGGGKSDALLMAALQYVDVPGYSAGIFRLTEVDLVKPDAILARAHEWLKDTPAKWDDDLNGYRFPSGATIHFGYARTRKEVEQRYQGVTFQFIGIDELGQWTEAAYTYLFSRLRRLKGSGVPIRMRANANPGGVGAEWVRKRFAEFGKHPATGMTVREYISRRKSADPVPELPIFVSPPSTQAVAVAEELGRVAQGAYFVPAYASDNPGLDVTEYRSALARLDAATRAQLEHGDFWANAGGKFFKEEWFRYEDAPPPSLRWLRAWDLAATDAKKRKGRPPDYTAGVKMALETKPDGSRRLWISNVRRTQKEPGETETFVKSTAELDGRMCRIVMEQEGGSAGKNNTFSYAKTLFGWVFEGVRKTGSKTDEWRGLSSDAQNGLLVLVRGPWNEEFVRELCALTDDDTHPNDDMADAAALGRSKLIDSKADRLRALAQ